MFSDLKRNMNTIKKSKLYKRMNKIYSVKKYNTELENSLNVLKRLDTAEEKIRVTLSQSNRNCLN